MIEKILQKAPTGTIKKDLQKERIYRAVGCPQCNSVGFSGQIVLSEVLLNDSEIEGLITGNALASEINATAIKNGMIPLSVDGVLAALEGRTTLDEIRRVTDE